MPLSLTFPFSHTGQDRPWSPVTGQFLHRFFVSQGDLASGSRCCLPSASPTEPQADSKGALGREKTRTEQTWRKMKKVLLQGLSLLFHKAITLFAHRCHPQRSGVKLRPILDHFVAVFKLSGVHHGGGGSPLWIPNLTGAISKS